MSHRTLDFDKDVYDDAALTSVAEGPFSVTSSTILPYGIYFTPNTVYVGTSKNNIGDILYTVTFNSTDNVTAHPEDATINITSTALGAVYAS